jgi:signal transduction histidine kinase
VRLLPRSLFGRLVLVLVGGLILAQLASVYINASERDQLLYRAGGLQLAQRITDIAKLLDTLPAGERRKIAGLFNAPPLTVSLDRPLVATGGAPSESDIQLSMFTNVLRYTLGDDMQLNVQRRAGSQAFGPGRAAAPGMPVGPFKGPGPMMRGFSHGGAQFIVQVGLHDGNWVTFDSYLTPQDTDLPMRVALTLAVLLGTVLVLSLIAVRWVTRPLAALATAAEALGENIDRPPLAESGPLEVQRAARAFNTMQQRLARFIADRARVFTAMSHDLKTPITRMRLRTEMLEDETLRSKFESDLEQMEAMVTQTLDFMRDTSRREEVQRVDVMALLETLQTDYQDGGSTVSIDAGAAEPYPARPLALRRCISNLLDNAIRYGERAAITVKDDAHRLTITVRDAGPGIPETDLVQAFEPFFRGEASRSRETGGTGLGLGIARNIARAHGGDLVLRNHPAGGLEAILSLPR